MSRIVSISAVAFLIVAIMPLSADAGVVFGVDNNGSADQIVRINSDGSNSTVLFEDPTGDSNPRGIAYDSIGDRIFFTDVVDRTITSVAATGGGTASSFGTSGAPISASFDNAGGRVFIYEGNPVDAIASYPAAGGTPADFYVDPDSSVSSANIGSNNHTAIDGNAIYFAPDLGTSSEILRGNLTTAATTTIFANPDDGIRGLAINGDSLYFVSNDTDTINQLDISGTAATLTQTIALDPTVGNTPQGLATDGNFLYYAETNTSAGRGIYRYNLDLTGRTQIFSGDGVFYGVAGVADVTAVPEPASMLVLGMIGGGAMYRRRGKRSDRSSVVG